LPWPQLTDFNAGNYPNASIPAAYSTLTGLTRLVLSNTAINNAPVALPSSLIYLDLSNK
jgi:hypothetical protein